jgi:putative ABC transport system ATP-binding protein
MDNTPLIRARGLKRHYQVGKQEVRALDGVDLDVAHGEFIALVGPSGSGKSTLLNLLGGLDHPSSGEIYVAELELGKATDQQLVRYRRERIGFIFQSFNLLQMRSAVENVETPLMLAEVKPKERRARALELLQSVGLALRASHKPNELSGGEMQRVAVARSLANRPLLLLADEPTGNLDSQTGKGILDLLRETVLAHGVTLVLVTHDMNVASFADRIVHMLDGRIQYIEDNTANRLEERSPENDRTENDRTENNSTEDSDAAERSTTIAGLA